MISINLLPPELKLKRIEAKRNASLISICFVIILVLAVLAVIGESARSTVIDYLDAAKKDVQNSSTDLESSQDIQDLAYVINDRAATTDTINKTRVVWSQVLQELSNSTPNDVQFSSLTCNGAKSPNFTLQGNTTTEREIIKFKEKLENSPVFKNVSFKSSTRNTTEAAKLDFNLEFDLEIVGSKSVSGASNFTNNQLKQTK